MASRPTLSDIAAATQLSVTQVSRALNGHLDVAETTRARVKKAADELGYVPNLEARRLKAPDTRAHAIGLILPNQTLQLSDPFFGELVAGIVVEAAVHGLEMHLSTPVGEADPIVPYEQAIRNKRVDGFILLRTEVDDPRIEYLTGSDVPFVAFGRPEGATGFASVELSLDCMRAAVDHLVGLGHEEIACIAEPRQFNIGAQRLRSLHRSANLNGLGLTVVEAGFGEDEGFDAAMELLGRKEPPSAIVALNDLLALGALHAAAELSIPVPSQLSVVGFDDIAAARLVRPGLTTLHQSAHEVGSLLVEELVLGIELGSPNRESRRFVEPRLVIRESTGPGGPP